MAKKLSKGGSSSRRKTKKTSSNSRPQKPRVRKYPAPYLAIVLASALILEGILFGASAASDWQKAVTVLDVSSGVSETAGDVAATFQPLTDMVESIDQFYQLSATEMMHVLDLSDSGFGLEIGFIYNGVSDFYEQSSVQMAELLDIFKSSPRLGTVAGASIEK